MCFSSMKYLVSILMFFTSHSYATESIDCTNDNIWFQFHFSLSSSEYDGYTLHMEDGILGLTEVSKNINFKSRNIYVSGQSDKGAVIFKSKANAGFLNIGGIGHKLNCDWMAYDENT